MTTGEGRVQAEAEPRLIRSFELDDWNQIRAAYEEDAVAFLEHLGRHAIRGNGACAALNLEAGSGTIALELAGASRKVHCTEDTPYRVERARARLARVSSAEVHHAPVDAIPLSEGSMDESYWLLPALPQARIAGALPELLRILRGAGTAVFLLWSPPCAFRGGRNWRSFGSSSAAKPTAGELLALAALQAGFSRVENEWCICECVAPSLRAVAQAIRCAQFPARVREVHGLPEEETARLPRPGEVAAEPTRVRCDFWVVRAEK